MSDIHVFNHNAMATQFQVRIAGEERTYAEQAAQAAFALVDELESYLSRFRASSDISHLAGLGPGETLRGSEPVFACLGTGQKNGTGHASGAFSVAAAAARQSQPAPPHWTLQDYFVRCESGKLEFDSGLPSARALRSTGWRWFLREWSCTTYLSWWPVAAAFWPETRLSRG